jgi:hypothetical protein
VRGRNREGVDGKNDGHVGREELVKNGEKGHQREVGKIHTTRAEMKRVEESSQGKHEQTVNFARKPKITKSSISEEEDPHAKSAHEQGVVTRSTFRRSKITGDEDHQEIEGRSSVHEQAGRATRQREAATRAILNLTTTTTETKAQEAGQARRNMKNTFNNTTKRRPR